MQAFDELVCALNGQLGDCTSGFGILIYDRSVNK